MEKYSNDNYSILIVDDVPKNIQLVAKFLTKEGYKLHFAQSGEAALKQIENIDFNLILLDIMMPEMDGFEVCRKIKENKKSQLTPVIFITAKTDEEGIRKGFSSGGVDYITKPFNAEELLARVQTHIRLQSRENELRELNSTKDTILSIISHDLKTPFFNIMGLGEILLNSFSDFSETEKKELITNIVDSARASHNLLDNLLNWIRMQTGKIAFFPTKFELNSMVHGNIGLAKLQSDNKGVKLVYHEHDIIQVFADENMVNTILRNLLNNAIKYTGTGGKIEVFTVDSGNEAIISVKDTGVGIPKDKIDKLFIYGQAASTPGTNLEMGSGFGLIISNDFVRLNNGKLVVNSEIDKGTTFSFSLPKEPTIDKEE
jgi:two-component system, sensor histidine kinase and response regulator